MQLIFFYDLSFALTSAVKKRYLVHFGKQDCKYEMESDSYDEKIGIKHGARWKWAEVEKHLKEWGEKESQGWKSPLLRLHTTTDADSSK